jgi:hypothetical protein
MDRKLPIFLICDVHCPAQGQRKVTDGNSQSPSRHDKTLQATSACASGALEVLSYTECRTSCFQQNVVSLDKNLACKQLLPSCTPSNIVLEAVAACG